MIQSELDFNEYITAHTGVLFYFATTSCSVGEALEPKVRALLKENFPKLMFRFIDMNQAPELSAAHQVFVEPTILLYVEGKEFLRRSRHIGLSELDMAISRIYDLAFE
jgi:thiol-disulfide isomerase/thioredoxin